MRGWGLRGANVLARPPNLHRLSHAPRAQVKAQFQTRPHIYNKFLEIMKEFKAKRCVWRDGVGGGGVGRGGA